MKDHLRAATKTKTAWPGEAIENDSGLHYYN